MAALDSLFVTGTDTDVGKTCITAGLAVAARKMGADVGVMKPFAAGIPQKSGYKSADVQILSDAAKTDDPESMVNPQFFPILASPYTAWKNLKTRPKIKTVLSNFKRLERMHQTVLVEGIGGVMTPILDGYYVTDLIKEMQIPAVIVTSSRIGTINHTVMTCKMCINFGIPLRGIIINRFGGGYPAKELARDIQSLTKVKVLGTIPTLSSTEESYMYRTFKKSLDLESLFTGSDS